MMDRAVKHMMVAGVALLISQVLTPVAGAQQTPSIDSVEVRTDHSALVAWVAVEGETAYDIAVRPAGTGSWQIVDSVQVDVAPAAAEIVRRVLNPNDWNPTSGISYELSVRVAGGDFGPFATFAVGGVLEDVRRFGATLNSLTLSWTPVAASEAFERYDVFAASSTSRLEDCKIGEVTDRSTATFVVENLAAACESTALEPNTAYSIGMRVVHSSAPAVVSELTAATMATIGGSPLPQEQLSTAPVNGTWQIITADGQPVVLKSINVRRGELTSYAFNAAEFTDIRQRGFDSVRIVVEWDQFEPAYGEFHAASFAALDRAVGFAETAGVNVILDPLHLAEGPSWNIPAWAWEHTNDGALTATATLDAVRENAASFLRHVAGRYRDRPNVIAIDVLNEPREPGGRNLDANNVELIELYHDLIELIRDIEPDKPLLLEPFYGSAIVSPERLFELDDATQADPSPNPQDTTNLIWSIHDYYAGREGTAADDGYTDGGYPLRGTAPDGTLYRSESFSQSSCYPSGPDADNCTNDTGRVATLIPSMRRYLTRHVDAAQQAGMPLYVGEFGIPHAGFGFPGWGGGDAFLTDKVSLYDELGLGRALWAYRIDVDPTFGMYDRGTNSWHPWTDFATGDAVADWQIVRGDVNCDGESNILDALVIAQYGVGSRQSTTGCPLDDPFAELFPDPGDLNGDGNIDILDALAIAQCSIGVDNVNC